MMKVRREDGDNGKGVERDMVYKRVDVMAPNSAVVLIT